MEDRVDKSEQSVQHSDASGRLVLPVSQTAFDLLYHALICPKGSPERPPATVAEEAD